VLTIASVAAIWGLGFPMMRIVLNSGISVGALLSVRFVLAGLWMFVVVRAKGITITRRGLVDGIWLGLLLVVIFWLQADGLRYTTTAKSGFITGLYVLFTPLVAVIVGQRVKLASAIGALIATCGLYLLVHVPGGFTAGWNRGDFETLLCAVLCGVHMVMTGAFTLRSDPWLLAGTQVSVTGMVSLVITAFLPTPAGFQNLRAELGNWPVIGAMLYMALFCTVIAFWGQAVAQTRLGPTEAAVLFCIEPVSAAFLSVVWLKEQMSFTQVLGGALMVAAMIVAEALPAMLRMITVPDTRP
jgi:drug/metabolite transporter (DMT)-like permease